MLMMTKTISSSFFCEVCHFNQVFSRVLCQPFFPCFLQVLDPVVLFTELQNYVDS